MCIFLYALKGSHFSVSRLTGGVMDC